MDKRAASDIPISKYRQKSLDRMTGSRPPFEFVPDRLAAASGFVDPLRRTVKEKEPPPPASNSEGRVELVGQVKRVFPHFAFAKTHTGQTIYVPGHLLDAVGKKIDIGWRIRCEAVFEKEHNGHRAKKLISAEPPIPRNTT